MFVDERHQEHPLDGALPSSGVGAPASTPATEPSGAAAAPPRFDAIYEEHFEFAWRNLRRLGVRDVQLSDAAQDVFLVVHRRLPDFELRAGAGQPGAGLRSWLYSIVVRVARQYRRGLRRKPSEGIADVGEVPDPTGAQPERSAQNTEALRQLLALLAQLDDDKREAFVLAELEGLSAPEIGEILGVNVNTIYARIRAARRALTALLAQQPHPEGA